MWFSGLRGAVAFALGVTFLEHPDFSEEIKGTIFGTTVMVVVLTILIFGGLTPYMLRWLNIIEEVDGIVQFHANEEAIPIAEHGGQSYNTIEHELKEDFQNHITEEDLQQPVFGWLYRFDSK